MDRNRISNSFHVTEIDALCVVFERLSYGGDVRVLMRASAFLSAAGKLRRMKERAALPAPAMPIDLVQMLADEGAETE